MAHRVVMPKLGLTMEKGVVVHWLKKEGEKVEKGEKLLEVETDKIVNEIESPAAGILLKVLVEEGTEADVQTLLAVIGDQDEDVASLLGSADSRRQEEPAASRAQPRAAASAATPGEESGIRITPRARKLMARHGLHVRVFAGYDKSRVTEDDVKEFLQRQTPTETPPASGQDAPGLEAILLGGMRKRIADRMSASKREIPHAYFRAAVDASAMVALRAAAEEPNRPSFNDILIKSAACALQEVPELNAAFQDGKILRRRQINIGLAVSVESGLIVPVIKRADTLSLSGIRQTTRALIQKARSNGLGVDDVQGGTFTISNLGMYPVRDFIAIVNPPEVAILSAGRIEQRPCVQDGRVAVRPEMNLTLSVDHRVIDGEVAGKFLQALKNRLESLEGVK